MSCHPFCERKHTRVKLAIIRRDGNAYYLVLTEETDRIHNLPGGHIKENEQCRLQTLSREVSEEFGKEMTFTDEFLISHNPISEDNIMTMEHETIYEKTLLFLIRWDDFDPYYINELISNQLHDTTEECKKEVVCLREIDLISEKTPDGNTIAVTSLVIYAIGLAQKMHLQ